MFRRLFHNDLKPRKSDLPLFVDDKNILSAKIISGPKKVKEIESWRNSMMNLKAMRKVTHDSSQKPNYSMGLFWIWDEIVFDHNTQEFKLDNFLQHISKFGGLDSIILWQSYPNLGVDNRNQFQIYLETPGLRELISGLQAHGILVFMTYNPWDKWTSDLLDHEHGIVEVVTSLNFDGIFLDTINSLDSQFLKTLKVQFPNLIIGGETNIPTYELNNYEMSWAQWCADSDIPGVLRAKWLDQKHSMFLTRRWNTNKLSEILIAWLNGAGVIVWENVFGSTILWSEQDALLIKNMTKYQRRFHKLIQNGYWEPLTFLNESASKCAVFASKFTLDKEELFCIINSGNRKFKDVILNGIAVEIEPRSISGLYINDGLHEYLDFPTSSKIEEKQVLKPIRKEKLSSGKEEVHFSYRNRECGMYSGAPFVDRWKPLPPNFHEIITQSVKIEKVDVEEFEVTNEQYFEFLNETKYQPINDFRFLAHWVNRKPKYKELRWPVVFVSLNDARAYAKWKGTRLPNEFEWQFSGKSRLKPEVWNWTESEHSDGRTRFCILKGGSTFKADSFDTSYVNGEINESDWYISGGIKNTNWQAKYLLTDEVTQRSNEIGFKVLKPII